MMIGQTLAHYRILEKLGAGGMGEVYLAEDTELDRKVALKVLPAALAADPERLERFRREAKAVAALNHPNIVTIHSIEESKGQRFLTMELVEGKSLDQMIRSDGLPLAKVFDIAVPLADALAVAHERGIIHRDLKPANVMVTDDGRVKVLDFGLAKLAPEPPGDLSEGDPTTIPSGMATLTGEGMAMGTAPYMSPEQLQGKSVDHRTDIFSLGIVLYEMASGQRPFQGDSAVDLASSILRDTPRPVTDLNASLPRHLGRIVQHCLEKDLRNRYQSTLDVRNELRTLRKEVDSGAVATDIRSIPDASTASAANLRSFFKPATLAAVTAVIALVALALVWRGFKGPDGETAGATRTPVSSASEPAAVEQITGASVAVLPFTDLSPAKDQEYFTDGMTEELIIALSKVEGLNVPGRTAVFGFKGREDIDLQEIGDKLGVNTVLVGSVRKAGDQLRIAAQLVKVEDGFPLWSETYDRKLEDVFAIQGEIATNIVQALQVTLEPGAVEPTPTADLQAYDFYLRGRRFFYRRGERELQVARQMFYRAIETDPNYALAYAGLSDVLSDLNFRYGGGSEILEEADRASLKAVELDPDLAEAHSSRGFILSQRGQFDEAEHEFETAIALDPKLFEAYYYYARSCFSQGKLEKATVMFEKASDVRPEDYLSLLLVGPAYKSLGRQAEAESANRRGLAVLEKHLDLNPEDVQALVIGSAALVDIGERDKGLEWADLALAMEPDDARLLYNLACTYALAGRTSVALKSLAKSVDLGWRQRSWTENDSDLDSLREHPRFQALLERMGSTSS